MDEDVWAGLYPFQSVSFIQRFLKQCYGLKGIEKAEEKSYRNSYPFLYYLQHGEAHYKLAHSAQASMQPLLLFYGMSQLVKACLLTVDPEYPRTTSVLAHGVSTRKKKKKDYAFVEDEVMIQKHGLAAHLSKELFELTDLEGKKYAMKPLFERIPDLNDLIGDLYGQKPFLDIETTNDALKIPLDILDDLHMTVPRLIDFLSDRMNLTILSFAESTGGLLLIIKNLPSQLPFSLEGQLFLSRKRNDYDGFPELLVHLLLLYNLSMIARYETEWWSELFHQATDDLPLIDKFLAVSKKKVPLLISQYLRNLM